MQQTAEWTGMVGIMAQPARAGDQQPQGPPWYPNVVSKPGEGTDLRFNGLRDQNQATVGVITPTHTFHSLSSFLELIMACVWRPRGTVSCVLDSKYLPVSPLPSSSLLGSARS